MSALAEFFGADDVTCDAGCATGGAACRVGTTMPGGVDDAGAGVTRAAINVGAAGGAGTRDAATEGAGF